jgi:hypothetical protein
MLQNKRKVILNTIANLVQNFLYYDRKDDENLKENDIVQAIDDKIISIDEIVDTFRKEILNYFGIR